MSEGEWKPMPGYPPEFEPVPTTQFKWARQMLPITQGFDVLRVASANELLRHCRVGKVTFKSEQNHSAKCG